MNQWFITVYYWFGWMKFSLLCVFVYVYVSVSVSVYLCLSVIMCLCVVVELDSRALCMLDKHFTTKLHP